MRRAIFAILAALLVISPARAQLSSMSQSEIGVGLREALKLGAKRTVAQLGKADGYNADPNIHIPLPSALAKTRNILNLAGAGSLLDDLEFKMNRAAEKAAPKAFDIFADAISRMSFDDAKTIASGQQDAATQYLKRTTTQSLMDAFRPIVESSLNEVGAVQSYNGVTRRVPVAGFNLTDFALEKSLDGLFHYIAKEEAAIRTNPAARSTDILKKLFK
jgi:hypothetical protein